MADTNVNYTNDELLDTDDNVQHGIDDNPTHDAEKGAALGGIGGATVGAIAGAVTGPIGALIGAAVGGVAGAVASGLGVAAVDTVDNDNTVSGIGDDATTDWNNRADTATYDDTLDTTDTVATPGYSGAAGEMRVPVTEETAQVTKESREVGAVTVEKQTDIVTKHIAEPVTRTTVTAEMRDIPADQQYNASTGGTSLRDGEEIRVPVMEEEIQVQKVPRVTKEMVINTTPVTETVEQDVQLRRERVELRREGDADVDTTS